MEVQIELARFGPNAVALPLWQRTALKFRHLSSLLANLSIDKTAGIEGEVVIFPYPVQYHTPSGRHRSVRRLPHNLT
jgi:hypothetical protein